MPAGKSPLHLLKSCKFCQPKDYVNFTRISSSVIIADISANYLNSVIKQADRASTDLHNCNYTF